MAHMEKCRKKTGSSPFLLKVLVPGNVLYFHNVHFICRLKVKKTKTPEYSFLLFASWVTIVLHYRAIQRYRYNHIPLSTIAAQAKPQYLLCNYRGLG